jgi:hypothetical protein
MNPLEVLAVEALLTVTVPAMPMVTVMEILNKTAKR